eukprot:TRINITY_DN1219_c0_g1_i4.p1 TRINITY_DN1219_c0_g1~~TRINITY_DN1219_c0_g1_i4.p1  ORF type:complete len:178 (+),score=40.45 TRINITY_DN1219_c0_g1_i4:224-757(+)
MSSYTALAQEENVLRGQGYTIVSGSSGINAEYGVKATTKLKQFKSNASFTLNTLHNHCNTYSLHPLFILLYNYPLSLKMSSYTLTLPFIYFTCTIILYLKMSSYTALAQEENVLRGQGYTIVSGTVTSSTTATIVSTKAGQETDWFYSGGYWTGRAGGNTGGGSQQSGGGAGTGSHH